MTTVPAALQLDPVKDLLWDPLVKAATLLLFKAIPWLGWGPLGLVVGGVIGLFADQLYELAKVYIDFQRIALKNLEHMKAFDDAAVKLKIIAQGNGLDSPEYLAAREKHAKALSAFIRFAA